MLQLNNLNLGAKIVPKFIYNILFLVFCTTFMLRADVNFSTRYSEALAVAQKEKKPLMVTVVSTNCPWCHRFTGYTLKDKTVSERINREFVAVLINRDTDTLPSGISARLVPTTFFIDNNGKKLINPVVGYWDIENFSSYIDDAVKKVKK